MSLFAAAAARLVARGQTPAPPKPAHINLSKSQTEAVDETAKLYP